MIDIGLASLPTGCRPISAAWINVVPLPMNGSYTVSDRLVNRSMKNSGNCGLKQAR